MDNVQMRAAGQTGGTVAILGFAFIAGLIAWPVWLIYQQVTTRRDRNLTKVWGNSAAYLLLATVGVAALGAILKGPPTLGLWIFYIGFGSALFCGIASLVAKFIDMQKERKLRHFLGLEPRRRLLRLPTLTAIWFAVFIGGSLIWAYGLSVLIELQDGWTAAREPTSDELTMSFVFPALALLAGCIHFIVQYFRLKDEDNRLRRKDLEQVRKTA
ncbi:hypothetical protein ACIBM3_31145 [Rhodococcus erythropolis]|uniref:hypothetical protein n=1 Tax=Rhodococcus erythropolis TaxID=1833 RepID=UPI00379E0B42